MAGCGARVHDLLAKTRGGVCAGGAPQTLGEKCTAGYARGARGNRAAPCAFC